INTTHVGQAHWANTGPFGATCGECAFLGYFRQYTNKSGDNTKAIHHGVCEKFFQLTNKHSATVTTHAAAYRYFETRAYTQMARSVFRVCRPSRASQADHLPTSDYEVGSNEDYEISVCAASISTKNPKETTMTINLNDAEPQRDRTLAPDGIYTLKIKVK